MSTDMYQTSGSYALSYAQCTRYLCTSKGRTRSRGAQARCQAAVTSTWGRCRSRAMATTRMNTGNLSSPSTWDLCALRLLHRSWQLCNRPRSRWTQRTALTPMEWCTLRWSLLVREVPAKVHQVTSIEDACISLKLCGTSSMMQVCKLEIHGMQVCRVCGLQDITWLQFSP